MAFWEVVAYIAEPLSFLPSTLKFSAPFLRIRNRGDLSLFFSPVSERRQHQMEFIVDFFHPLKARARPNLGSRTLE